MNTDPLDEPWRCHLHGTVTARTCGSCEAEGEPAMGRCPCCGTAWDYLMVDRGHEITIDLRDPAAGPSAAICTRGRRIELDDWDSFQAAANTQLIDKTRAGVQEADDRLFFGVPQEGG